MKERPILFSAPMVRAILEGRKSVTRRIARLGITLYPGEETGAHGSPYGAPCDRLWVREAWHACPHCGHDPGPRRACQVAYRAGGWRRAPSGAPDDAGERDDADARPLSPKCAAHGWRPSIFMPRWASRISLEVVSVRAERLHEIDDADAWREGCTGAHTYSARDEYRDGWDDINGKRAPWDSNPWVWRIEFRRLEP